MIKNAYIFAGVNGAGKTTLYYNELEKSKDFGRRINIDEIVSSFGNYKSSKDQFRASKMALNMRVKYIEKGLDFNQESTLCGSSIINLFQKLKNEKYKIHLYYVGVDSPEIAKERVKIRVSKGGHFIKDEVVEKRFFESLNNLEKVLPLCDEVKIFDNSKEYKKIFELKKDTIKIFDKTKWLNLNKLLLIHKQTFEKNLNEFLRKEDNRFADAKIKDLESLNKQYEILKKENIPLDKKLESKFLQALERNHLNLSKGR